MKRLPLLSFALLVPLLGCAKDVMQTFLDAGSGGGGDGGAGGDATGGAGGAVTDAGGSEVTVIPPACDPAASTMGRVTDTTPLISVGKPVMASAGVMHPEVVVDGAYHSGLPNSFPTPTADAPPWIAIQVGAGPARVMLAWSDRGYGNYNDLSGGAPTAYRIETSGDSTNGADGTWDMAVTVTGNPVRNRAHTFPFAGKSWVRMVVTAAQTTPQLDEIAVHDITSAGDGRPTDTWFFMGDSITAGAFKRNLKDPFDKYVNSLLPAHFPVILNGGIGGELSSMGVSHIDQWLALNPDFTHFAILYGTNDSWGDKDAAGSGMEANLDMIVQKVLAAGRVPIVARIPYATVAHATLPAFNAIIDRISTEQALPCGPDFYGWFETHTNQLGPDGVHPADLGYVEMNHLWGNMAARLYPPLP